MNAISQPIQPTSTASAIASPQVPASSDSEAGKKYVQDLIAKVFQVCPQADQSRLAIYVPAILKALVNGGLVSKNQLISFIATCYIESDSFQTLTEYGSGDEYEGWTELGNTQTGDGVKFKGRGFIQITGRSNYKLVGQAFGVDLQTKPKLLETDIELCAKGSVWWWKGGTGNNPSKPAETGNWREARIQVNGGTNGMEKYMEAIDRGIIAFTEPLNPQLIGASPAPGNYGLNCIETGSAGSRMVNGGAVNPPTQADALAYALGLHLRDIQEAIKLHVFLNPNNYPEILTLAPTKKFKGKNFGEGLDGDMTVDEIWFYCGGSLEVEIWANQPDPNSPPPQVFLHNTDMPLNQNTGAIASLNSAPAATSAIGLQWAMPAGDTNVAGDKCEFGYARGRLHAGIDLGGFGKDDVFAAGDGTVEFVDWESGYGRMVDIKHPNQWMTRYAHLLEWKVKKGDQVKAGQLIGIRGGSGFGKDGAYAIHLHFETRNPSGEPVDPRTVLPQPQPPKV